MIFCQTNEKRLKTTWNHWNQWNQWNQQLSQPVDNRHNIVLFYMESVESNNWHNL